MKTEKQIQERLEEITQTLKDISGDLKNYAKGCGIAAEATKHDPNAADFRNWLADTFRRATERYGRDCLELEVERETLLWVLKEE